METTSVVKSVLLIQKNNNYIYFLNMMAVRASSYQTSITARKKNVKKN